MVEWKYSSPEPWIKECRRLVERDWDDLMWFSGAEGSGKSDFALQVLSAVDESFDVDRIVFGIVPFLRKVGGVPNKRAILGDELELSGRLAMHGPNTRFLQYLTECRGRNHHIAACYPHEEGFDNTVKNTRIRWRVHKPERGVAELYERERREWRKAGGVVQANYIWKLLGRWKVQRTEGRLRREYDEKKNEHMRTRGEQLAELAERASRMPAASSGDTGGVDVEGAVRWFSEARRKDLEKRGPRSSIHELP